MKQTIENPRAHITQLLFFMSIAFAIIIARLFYLQVYKSTTLFQLSQHNCLRIEKVIPPRGNIIDCNGFLIATNRPLVHLAWHGTGNKNFDQEQLDTLATLEQLFGYQLAAATDLLPFEHYGRDVYLANDLSFEQLSAVLEKFPCNKNLFIKTDFKRFYPQATVACHVLGYLSGIAYEPAGQMGLEKSYNETLRGTPGLQLTTINSIGRQVTTQESQRALNGDTIVTTLDSNVQQIAERHFPADCAGSCIVMDAQTGALRVMISHPLFDPNRFVNPLTSEEWQQLQEEKPFLNRALSAAYPPASLFKLVTLIASLETNIVTPASTWFCHGEIAFGNRKYHCMHREGHGLLTLQDALAKSCNIPFYEMGKRLKIDTLAQYAHMLGLGEKTNISLPEVPGLIANTAWKQATYKQPWCPGDTLMIAIGQSYTQVTPLQICRMINAICDGHLVTPRILEAEPIVRVPLTINPATLTFVRNSMRKVIERGTGQSLSYLKDVTIYGKTGTAQVRKLPKDGSKRMLEKADREHGWFAAYVRYKNYPPFVVVVLAEHVESSVISAHIARDFLKEYFTYLDDQTAQINS
jgi:penicillin-binding protein 2